MLGQSPNLIMAGCQKCGSTFLARLLGSYPEVDLAECKETNLFLHHDESRYEARFAEIFKGSGARYRLDASISYLVSDGAMARAAAWCPPDTRILILVRNPVDRTLSAYLHLKKRLADIRSIDEILSDMPYEAEAVRSHELASALRAMQKGDLDLFEGIDPHDERWLNALYLSNSLYALHLDRLFRIFRPEQVKLILFEDMIEDLQGTLADLHAFLDLPDRAMDTQSFKPSNRTVVPVNIPISARTSPWASALTRIRQGIGRNRKRHVTAEMFAEDVRRRIYTITEPQSRRLFELLGRDFEKSSWYPS